jgi:uncharacterized lipoprotein
MISYLITTYPFDRYWQKLKETFDQIDFSIRDQPEENIIFLVGGGSRTNKKLVLLVFLETLS